MPNNKVKTKSALQGKRKGGKALHENSRRLKQLVRVELREDKLTVAKRKRERQAMDKTDRLLHFAHQLDDQPSITLDRLHTLVADYLCRHDGAIANLAKERRPGRPKSKQQERFELERQADQKEYKSGFLVPDLTDAKAVKELRYWVDQHGGKPGFLPLLKLVRILEDEPGEVIMVQAGGALEDDAAEGEEDADMDHDAVTES